MAHWQTDNTEGFTAEELAELREAQAQLEARFPGIDPGNLADMLNNVWTDDKDARQLERDVARQIEA
jgi:predicted ATPase